MHSRKRSAAFLSDDTTTTPNDPLPPIDYDQNGMTIQATTETPMPSKRLQNPHGQPVPQSTTHPLLTYNFPRLLNALAFTRLYVTSNFQHYDPPNSPLILCCTASQSSALYLALCNILPSLYALSPNLQALALTAGYLPPNAVADQAAMQVLPLTTTAGLDGSVAEEFELFRGLLGQGEGGEDVVAVVRADGVCVWSSKGVRSAEEFEEGLVRAIGECGAAGQGRAGEVAMGDS